MAELDLFVSISNLSIAETPFSSIWFSLSSTLVPQPQPQLNHQLHITQLLKHPKPKPPFQHQISTKPMAELDLFVSLSNLSIGCLRGCVMWGWWLSWGWGWGIGVEEIENQMEKRESVEETTQRRERVSDGGERKS
uniref:Uncharacterized protein n=1 Tax=Fagus sylvatica TaxID=28930 RepID=A0A2N9GRM2_FAGSY